MIFTIRNKTDADAVKAYIDKCKEGIVYSVEIKKKTIRRTLPQNSLYWLYVTCIADETGNDKEAIHDELRRLFLPVHSGELGGRPIEKLTSTTTLNTVQFTHYIDKIVAFAASEIGIALPDPSDLYWEQFYEHYKDMI